ncbi:cysteine-rich KTR domain-containing protein [uncultured Oscillibacter sp.]|uniref:cysteine-rich KTR domain-containing protein n=1 Tax=uncultured Oscillibacter sp. TaxID=876091 RepID=UPI0025E7EB72|nr:cysteine-rich KTR domain-containing protein [uncultured Oscillibacter sp.]
MEQNEWVCCPLCGQKTRVRMRGDTVLIRLPLFCPKCKRESLINLRDRKVSVVPQPDAKTQC